jgi:predicted enzyme related to lactoylglutathione lyase
VGTGAGSDSVTDFPHWRYGGESEIMLPMVLGFHHIQITAPKGTHGQVRDFYGRVMQLMESPLPVSMRDRDLIWFHCGPWLLHVGFEDSAERLKTSAHIAYQVTDCAYWRKRLAENGVLLREIGQMTGSVDRFHFRDPFGNVVEMIEREP